MDLQTEKSDLMENVGTIPFLDYKHFASRIFFPEVQQSGKSEADDSDRIKKQPFFFSSPQNESLMKACVKDIGQVKVPTCCFSRLLS